MSLWIVLSDGGGGILPPGPDLRRGCLMFDIALSRGEAAVLLDHNDGQAALSLIYDPGFGFGLMQRADRKVVRHMLPTGAMLGDNALLQFRWNSDSGRWSLGLIGGVEVWGQGALPLPRGLLTGAMTGARLRSSALRWFGLTQEATIAPLPMIGPKTMIATPKGAVAAADLRAGNLVVTRDHGALPVLSAVRHRLPGRGSFAPVRLRAPYFGSGSDLLVSRSQQVLLSGVEVEYLFGEDEILVEAGHLADGTKAITEDVPALLPWVAIDLGCEAMLHSGGCALATARGAPLRRLEAFEMRALHAMRRKGAERSAA